MSAVLIKKLETNVRRLLILETLVFGVFCIVTKDITLMIICFEKYTGLQRLYLMGKILTIVFDLYQYIKGSQVC